jgi:hypothetical protein
MPKLQTLVPLIPSRTPINPATGKPLVGRLPEEAIILVLLFLPIADIATVARCSRRLSSLCRDERVWRAKLKLLDWQGPSPDEKGKGKDTNITPSQQRRASVASAFGSPPRAAAFNRLATASTSSSLSAAPGFDDDDEDGFGDFTSSSTPGPSTTGDLLHPNSFASISLSDPPLEPKRKKPVKDDLLLLFDEELEEDRSVSTSLSAKRASAPVSLSTRQGRSSSVDLFKKYHAALVPYYLSFQQHSTNSTLFISSDLTPIQRAHVLSNLTRFMQPPLAPTRSLQTLTAVRRNLQNAMDFYENSMLAEFEKADSKNDEVSMKQLAEVMWALNGCQSLVQVFLNKREMYVYGPHLLVLSLSLSQDSDWK